MGQVFATGFFFGSISKHSKSDVQRKRAQTMVPSKRIKLPNCEDFNDIFFSTFRSTITTIKLLRLYEIEEQSLSMFSYCLSK